MSSLGAFGPFNTSLNLGHVLAAGGVDNLGDLLALRHTYTEDLLRSASDATPGNLLTYTREQLRGPGKFPQDPPGLWAVFIADGGRRSRLVAVYENHGELVDEQTDTLRYFDLRESPALADLCGRLVVEWSVDAINWAKQGAAAARFPVLEIADPAIVAFPGFDNLVLSYSELREVVTETRYGAWQTALGAVQGIYVITDTANGKHYVGKADGAERILGRWRTYAETGHGGNVRLVELLNVDPTRVEHFQWSLLRVFAPGAMPDAVNESEAHFKKALGTVEHGYNGV